ncbi:MAG: adenylate cyclase [Peptococcaceae bacterium]|nr:adenylate cyclase [Peptococcaceae bacterium]
MQAFKYPLEFSILVGVAFTFICTFSGPILGLIVVLMFSLFYFVFITYQFEYALTVWPVSYPLFAALAPYFLNLPWHLPIEWGPKNNVLSTTARKPVKKEVTVLCLMIKNFSSLTEETDPQNVVNLVKLLMGDIKNIALFHGGTVYQYMDNMITVLFNGPFDLPQHGDKAMATAKDIQNNLRAKKDDYEKAFGMGIQVGMGINTGIVIVQTPGLTDGMMYAVMGDVLHIAARLAAKARAGELLLAVNTKKQLVGSHNVVIEGSLWIKEKERPLEIYRAKLD